MNLASSLLSERRTHLPFRCCYNSVLMRFTLKGTERPINQTIYREFNGISVLWDPIYAPVDLERHPYGTVLIPESTLETTGGTFGEMFLTSRGMISIPINDTADNGYYWHDRSVRNYRRNSQKV